MNKNQLNAELGFFESLKKEINKTLQDFDKKGEYSSDRRERFMKVAKRLCEEYNQEYSKANELLKFDTYKGLQYISSPLKEENPNEWYSTLHAILLACNKAIEGLKVMISDSGGPITNFRRIKERFLNFLKSNFCLPKKKWFNMSNPLVWLIFSLILIIISYFIYRVLK